MDPGTDHRQLFRRPEVVPDCIVVDVGDAGIDTNALQLPPFLLAECFAKFERIEVRIGVPEGFQCGMKEILPSMNTIAFLMLGSSGIDKK